MSGGDDLIQPDRLSDEIAIITGASSGMGAATARRFIAEGATVVLADVADTAGEELADVLGPRAHFQHLDVSDPGNWSQVVEAVEADHGPVTVLMNNAGIEGSGHIERFEQQTWERTLAVNLYGPLIGMTAVVPSMRRAGRGSIITVSSLQGKEADVGLVPYVAAKFGIRGLTKSAVVELGRYGIRANTILPGLVMTGLTAGQPDHYMGLIPLRRPDVPDRAGRSDDVAALAAFLASADASYVTGAEITIDGGKSVRFPTTFRDYTPELAALHRTEGTR